MSIPVLILGESGQGKSRSMKNLDPAKTLLIQAIPKPLPFKNADWRVFDGKVGNIFQTDKVADIQMLIQGTKKKIIVIDDFQYILANDLMRRWMEVGYSKFSEIGFNGWNIITKASQLPPDVRIYILAHSTIDENGKIKIKTPGKLLDTYSVEGMFTLVLRTVVMDHKNYFTTRNSGNDTVKTPEDMFEEEAIPNDLAVVDAAIQAYYPQYFNATSVAQKE